MSVSAVSTGGGYQEGDYKANGTINTGHIANFRYLQNTYMKKVITERKTQGLKLGDGKGNKTENKLDKINDLKKYNYKLKRNIKALNREVTQKNDDDEGEDNDKYEDSGDKFEGNQYKKR